MNEDNPQDITIFLMNNYSDNQPATIGVGNDNMIHELAKLEVQDV